jgi:hypothetical protein
MGGGRQAHGAGAAIHIICKETRMDSKRRNVLAAAGGALLAAGALALPGWADEGQNGGDTMYGHGMVWNRDLPGVLGELRLSFDLRVNLETGKGFGTAEDPVHPEFNTHFSIDSIQRQKRPGGESRFIMTGMTEPGNASDVSQPLRIIAETAGDTTAIAIRIGDHTFAGAGLVVIAIIAILIALLVPAVQ